MKLTDSSWSEGENMRRGDRDNKGVKEPVNRVKPEKGISQVSFTVSTTGGGVALGWVALA